MLKQSLEAFTQHRYSTRPTSCVSILHSPDVVLIPFTGIMFIDVLHNVVFLNGAEHVRPLLICILTHIMYLRLRRTPLYVYFTS